MGISTNNQRIIGAIPHLNGAHDKETEIHPEAVHSLIENKSFTAYFQPIFSAKDGSIYGYEALARISETGALVDIGQIFAKAGEVGLLSSLDITCREAALRQAMRLGLHDSYLFLNVCPETLMDPMHQVGITCQLVEECQLSKDKIVLEITEEVAVKDYNLFCTAIDYYRKQGYRIAIDDFGAGYGGLKMLSIIEPDFVKIDRHFVAHMQDALVRYNLVDSIATACHRLGIKVVAEGIEQEQDLQAVAGMGIEFLQGYYLARPSPDIYRGQVTVPHQESINVSAGDTATIPSAIGDIAGWVEPVTPNMRVLDVLQLFMQHKQLRGIPVVEDERVIGMLHRNIVLEQELLGRFGYGFALNTFKTAHDLIKGHSFLTVEANCTLEEVSQRIQLRSEESLHHDLCVTKNGKYYGTVAMSVLLKAITERNLSLARAANPLTGLPGSIFIQGEIEKRIAKNMYFDVAYIDMDNFKPYNDRYGFEKGDQVIKALGQILQEANNASGDTNFGFVGHIGGDDFILVNRPQHTLSIAQQVIAEFEARRAQFHEPEDLAQGFYVSKTRRGETETFHLLTLSIGIVSSEVYKIDSFAQLSSLASEVKKAAKMLPRSSIVRDRRMAYSVQHEDLSNAEKFSAPQRF